MITKTEKIYSQRKTITFLSLLIITTISIRLYFLPFEVPFKTDAIDYFSFAFEVSKNQKFPFGILQTNDGWPILLSPIFTIIGQSDMMNLINAQRITSVVISSLTIIPIFFLCKKFVSSKYALIGASLFGFSYRLMDNSILGLSESLFLFLISFVLLYSLSKNSTYFIFSFIFLSLSAIVRYESLIFLIPLTIVFFIKFRKQKISYLKFSLFIFIFILILLPISSFRIESNGIDGLVSHTFANQNMLNPNSFTSISEPEKIGECSYDCVQKPSTWISNELLISFMGTSLFNTLKFLGFVLIPLFIFFIPTGIYNLIKLRNKDLFYLLIFGIFLIIPAMYAFGREIQDVRYLFVLFPIFCAISVYGLNSIKKFQKTKFVVLIITVIILSSIILLIYEQPNYIYSNEILQVTKNLVQNDNGINDYPGNSYVKIATLEKNWPESLPIASASDNFEATFFIKKIPSGDYDSLEEYILNSKELGLTHIVLTENNRSLFLDKLLKNYQEYSYLEKVFDSENHNFENKIIVLKINYLDFEKHV